MTEKIKYVYVVLHYNKRALNDTFECIQSLKKISKNTNYKIIVVENGSNDKSAQKILKEFEEDKYVDCIISEKNLGFAKGNNLGCDLAKEKYNPEYLIVLNNDTYILQEDFLKTLEEVYRKTHFDILGPYIYDRNLKPQNPVLNLKTSIEEIDLELKNINKVLKTNSFEEKIKTKLKTIVFSQPYLEKILRKILKKPKIKDVNVEEISKKTLENVGLHGACLVFSKNYMNKYKDIFYPGTFMYVEEDILYNRVLRDKLTSVYCPKLKIYHKEDRSTEAMVGEKREKQIFILKNVKKSLEIYKDILLNGE